MDILYWIDVFTIIIFTLEVIIKIVVYGFLFNGKSSYLLDSWNILDLIILVFSYICLTPLESTFKFVKTLRILRSLRLIGRNEGLKVAVRALYFAIPNILGITACMIVYYIIFGMICVSHFKGKMYYCKYTLGNIHFSSKHDCLNFGGLWL